MQPTTRESRPGYSPDAVARLSARAQSAVARSAAVEKVIAAMHERLDAPFLLDDMASLAYLSPYYFNRVFRQVTGVPPRRFHTALRMAAAKRLLLTTDLSVTEICFDLGYQSLGTFTTQFHELVGVSPRALRRLADDPPCTPAELLAALEHVQADGASSRRLLTGNVAGPDDASEWLVFIGLFANGSPQGLPAACTARVGCGQFQLAASALHPHVAAVAFPCSDEPRAYLCPDKHEVMVAAAPARTALSSVLGRGRELRLRHVRSTDPPVLLALPLLLGRRVAAREMLEVA
jgi:AraC family transcriptional regulator